MGGGASGQGSDVQGEQPWEGLAGPALSPPWEVLGPEGEGGLQRVTGAGEGRWHYAVLQQIRPTAWIREGGTSPPPPIGPCP